MVRSSRYAHKLKPPRARAYRQILDKNHLRASKRSCSPESRRHSSLFPPGYPLSATLTDRAGSIIQHQPVKRIRRRADHLSVIHTPHLIGIIREENTFPRASVIAGHKSAKLIVRRSFKDELCHTQGLAHTRRDDLLTSIPRARKRATTRNINSFLILFEPPPPPRH